MKYCQDCGAGHDCTAPAGDGKSDAVRIAELETKRDIEVARLAHSDTRAGLAAEVEVAELEAEAGVEAAEAVAGALTDVLAPEPEPMPEPAEPVVVVDDVTDEPADAPPPREERDHPSEPREPARKTGFF